MKVVIREGMFETNSSSVHTLTMKHGTIELGKGDLSECKLPRNKQNYIIGKYGVFDCDGSVYTQEDKLSYLLTSLWYVEGYSTERVRDSWGYSQLEEILKKYTGCAGLVLYKRDANVEEEEEDEDTYHYGEAPYIDHQSVPCSYDEMIIDLFDEFGVVNFLFNDKLYIAMERD